MKNLAFVISGPSGVGKTTIRDIILKRAKNIVKTISTTTRAIRPGEQDGVDYFFTTVEDFEKRIEQGDFLEWAKVHGNFYGTSKAIVEEILNQGKDVIMVLDVQGGRSIKKFMPDRAVLIFLSPPNMEELKRRLLKRGQDSEEVIELRLKNAVKEMEALPSYHYNVINDNLDYAVDDVMAIIKAEHLRIRN